jgi:PAS domain S-box-containing protein
MVKKALNLLILEDNPDDAELSVKGLKQEGFDVEWSRVDTEEGFRKAIAEGPDLIIADYSLPSFDGMSALRIQQEIAPEIPLIIVSGAIGEDVAVECMRSGATDYVLKDMLSRLGPIVKRALEEAEAYRERKRMEQALRESEGKYRVLFETAKDAIFLSDVTGKFVDVNSAACESLGYNKEELLKLSNRKIDADPRGYEAFKKVRNGLMKEAMFEVNQQRKDGTLIPVEISGNVIESDGGKIFLAIARDITDRKQAEEELAKYRNHLEELVKERTRDLEAAHEELIQRERLSVLGQLTATVSHDLRNPLGVIRSSAFYLQRKLGGKNEKADKHLNRIEKQVALCDTIVGDLLEYTRGSRSEVIHGEINPLLEEVLEEVSTPEHVALVSELSPELPMVIFDRDKMRRVMINLIRNAFQAVTMRRDMWSDEQGPYQPLVKVMSSNSDNGIRLEVEDNGTGMDDKTARRAFEPLFTGWARGTGLGLAIVKKIVEEHSGSVSLESIPDHGTKVTIVIPTEN